jgi:hypothetical protein
MEVTRIVLAVFVALTALGAQAAVQELPPFTTVSPRHYAPRCSFTLHSGALRQCHR